MKRRFVLRRALTALLVIFGLPIALFYLAALNEAYRGSSTADFFPEGRDEPVWYPQGIDPDTYRCPGLPAVLLISDEHSIDNDMREKAENLNSFGYVVRIPDLYAGKQARGIPATRILRRINSDGAVLERVRAAWEALLSDPTVDETRVALAGLDFGADLALALGREDPRPAATVLFYPGRFPATEAQLGLVGAGGPVLAILADGDDRLTLEDQAVFASLLNAAGREFDRTIYEDTRRGFVQSVRSSNVGASLRAWLQMLTFLKDQFLM
jgi:dienelactone hydrolase